jgi:hypothetical protein
MGMRFPDGKNQGKITLGIKSREEDVRKLMKVTTNEGMELARRSQTRWLVTKSSGLIAVISIWAPEPRMVQDPVSLAHASHIMSDRQRIYDDESARSSEGFEHRVCNVYSM